MYSKAFLFYGHGIIQKSQHVVTMIILDEEKNVSVHKKTKGIRKCSAERLKMPMMLCTNASRMRIVGLMC